ncbi:MAG: tape measure protein [Reyranellaceae bacterium]
MADKSVAIRLSVKDAEQVRATLERLGKDGDAAIRKIDRAVRDSERGFSTLESGMAKLRAGVAGLAGGLSVGAFAAFARNIADIGSELAALQARVGNISGQFERSREVFLDVFAAAQRVGVGVETAADAFSRLSLAARDIGATTTQVTQVTETVLKLGRIGGSSMRDVANATVQLGQALASGRLQGDELRSILENMPLVGRAIAKEFGVSVGQLRELGADGELVAERIFAALLKAAEEADREFAKLPATMEQSGARAADGWKLLAVALDDSLGISQLLGAALEGIGAYARTLAGRIAGDLTQQVTDLRVELEKLQKLRTERDKLLIDPDARARAEAYRSGTPGAGPSGLTDRPDTAREEELRTEIALIDLVLQARARERATAESDAALDAKWAAQAKAAKESAAAVAELVQTYDPAAAKAAKLADAQATLQKAVASGVKTQEEADRILRDYEASLTKADPAAKKLADSQAKIGKAVADSIATMEQEIYLLGLSEKQRFVEAKVIELQRQALEAKRPLSDEEIRQLKETAARLYDVTEARDDEKKAADEAAREARRQREEFEREAERQAEAQRELLLEPWREAWRSIQQMGASAIEQLFSGSLKSAKDFWEEFKTIALRALAQIASAEITVAIQGVFGVGGPGGASGSGGIGGILGQIFGSGASPYAGAQNLPTNSGGGIGSLFGSGSIGSFLARPLSSFGIGSPGLDPTGAAAYLGLAESGGIGGFLGDLSLGQGLGALGGLAGGIAGLATGNYVGGITSLLGAGLSLIPGVGQVLGPIVAIAGGLLGGLLGGPKKPPRKSLQLLTTGGDTAGFERGGATAITPFGTLGYDRLGTNQQFVSTEYSANLIEAVADIDRAIAELLTGAQIAQVSAALRSAQTVQNNYRNNPDREAFDSAKDRLETMLRALYGGSIATKGLAGIARSDENIEELANRAGNIIQLKNAIEDFGKETTVAEEAVRQLNKEFADMSAKAEDWGFSDADVAKIEQERRRQISRLATDFNDGVALALLGMEDPYAAALQELEKDQAKRLAEAQYLNTVSDVLVDINKLEELFGKERVRLQEQALEAAGESWDDFVKRFLFGDLSQRSNREQYELAQAEFADVRARAEAAYANDNLDPALAAEFQREAVLALQWSRTYQASSAATAQLAADIERLARLFGDIPGGDIPGMDTGGSLGPGLVRVGERGAEIIRLFQPARVYSREASDGMLGGFDLAGLRQALRETALEQIHQNADGQGMIVALLRTLVEEIRAEARDRRLREAAPASRRRSAAR